MKHCLFIAFGALALASSAYCQRVIINEIMYAPKSPEPEWIELFNLDNITYSTKGWTISNHLRTYPLALDTIAPGEYLILTKDSAAAGTIQKKYAASNLHILITKIPPLGNNGDTIVIKDSLGAIVDRVAYLPEWGGTNGISLERIDSDAPSDSSNFGSCIDPLGGTPGKENSIRRRDFDLALESLTYRAANGNDLDFTATIVNKGRKEITDGTVSLYANSGLPVAVVQITVTIPQLAKQDFLLTWQNADYGRSSVKVIVNEDKDEVRSNDTIFSSCYFPVPRNAIVINEIMAVAAAGSCQWIELYNQSRNVANLDSTALKIELNAKFYTFFIDSFRFSPKQYAVIAADSNFFTTFPSLQNQNGIRILNKSDFHLKDSGNQVMLVNSDQSIIDSLHFYPYWDITGAIRAGVSLERKLFSAPSIDAGNWSSSSDPRGSTPLEKNSDVPDTTPVPKIADVQIFPNPFSPDGDGFEDVTTISIQVPSENQEMISVKLYDLRGRIRKTIFENQGITKQLSFSFDGRDDSGVMLPIGLYTLVVESADGLFAPQRKGIVIIKKPR